MLRITLDYKKITRDYMMKETFSNNRGGLAKEGSGKERAKDKVSFSLMKPPKLCSIYAQTAGAFISLSNFNILSKAIQNPRAITSYFWFRVKRLNFLQALHNMSLNAHKNANKQCLYSFLAVCLSSSSCKIN